MKIAKVIKEVGTAYMNINVILTFKMSCVCCDSQDVFDLRIPISKKEKHAVSFVDNKLFKRIVKKCNQYGRCVEDMIKISTASDWGLFERTTNLTSLCNHGHPCKWYFGNGRNDLDVWEKSLMSKYAFGTNADMSYLNA